MAQSEQARLIASLTSKGYSIKDIAALTGRTPRYITHARDSQTVVGKGGKVAQGRGQNLIPFLKELDEKGKVSPSSVPDRRKGKGGKVAGVRKGVKEKPTQSGKKFITARVKKGPATLRKVIVQAAKTGSHVKWSVNFKKATTKSKQIKSNVWSTGQLPSGWDAQKLLDRIDNPDTRAGDTWAAGDVNAALAAIALEQDRGITSASGLQEFQIWTS